MFYILQRAVNYWAPTIITLQNITRLCRNISDLYSMKWFLSPTTAPTLHFICKYLAMWYNVHSHTCVHTLELQFVGKRVFYHCQLEQMEHVVGRGCGGGGDVGDIPWRLMRHVCQTVRGCGDCYCYVITLQLWAEQ